MPSPYADFNGSDTLLTPTGMGRECITGAVVDEILAGPALGEQPRGIFPITWGRCRHREFFRSHCWTTSLMTASETS